MLLKENMPISSYLQISANWLVKLVLGLFCHIPKTISKRMYWNNFLIKKYSQTRLKRQIYSFNEKN